MIEEWGDAGFPVLTFEYMCQTPGMCDYFFWERTWGADLMWYRAKNVSHGAGGLIGPWFGFYKTPYFDQNGAKARWFIAYLTGHFDWDIDDDFDTVRDRMLSKYYRSAAKEMTAYHKYLEAKLYDAGVCMPYSDIAGALLLGRLPIQHLDIVVRQIGNLIDFNFKLPLFGLGIPVLFLSY